MRILFCNYEYPPLGGGGGVINALLAEELAGRHDVTVLTSQGLELPRESLENGVRIIRTPVFFRRQLAAANIPSLLAYIPMGIMAGRSIIGRESFDIINTHFVIPSGPVGHNLSKISTVPNILSVHGGDLYDPSKWTSPHRHALLRMWIRGLLRKADHVVGQSKNTIQNVHKYYDSSVEVSRIPLGIKRPPNIEASRQSYGFSTDDVLFVTVGRLVGRKAVDQLIHNLHELSNPKIHLLIIGDGPHLPALKQLAMQLGFAEKIHFYGFVDEVEKFRLLSIADIFATTSQHEGFGLVFLEAMAAGLPVICYDYGGQTDFLSEGVNGHLISLNDTANFKERCLELAQNNALRIKMGEFNRSAVEEFFIDRCAKKYETIFTEVIENKRLGAKFGYTSRT